MTQENQQLATTDKPLSKTPVIAGERGVSFSSMEDMWRFCTAVVNSRQFKDIESPEVALIRLQAGMELGLSPIWSITNVMVVNGRPSVWGDALLGIVQSKPDCEDVIETMEGKPLDDDYKAVCEVHRKGRIPVKREFTVADAKKAGLWDKPIWKQYPKRMLAMRARSWACRDSFADALRGLGVIEELKDVTPAKERLPAPKVQLPDEPPIEVELDTTQGDEGRLL